MLAVKDLPLAEVSDDDDVYYNHNFSVLHIFLSMIQTYIIMVYYIIYEIINIPT